MDEQGSSSKEIVGAEDIIHAISRVLGELDEAQHELIEAATIENYKRFQRARSRWFALTRETERVADFSEAMAWARLDPLEARNG